MDTMVAGLSNQLPKSAITECRVDPSDHMGGRMRRRDFIALLGVAAVAWPFGVHARRPSVPMIGFLGPSPSSTGGHFVHAFQQGLRELGYVEGRNVAIEYRSTEGSDNEVADDNQLALAAAELVRLGVDVLVTSITQAALA